MIRDLPVVHEHYNAKRIGIMFGPKDHAFVIVDTAARDNPDIMPCFSEIIAGRFHAFVRKFTEGPEDHSGVEFDEERSTA